MTGDNEITCQNCGSIWQTEVFCLNPGTFLIECPMCRLPEEEKGAKKK